MKMTKGLESLKELNWFNLARLRVNMVARHKYLWGGDGNLVMTDISI